MIAFLTGHCAVRTAHPHQWWHLILYSDAAAGYPISYRCQAFSFLNFLALVVWGLENFKNIAKRMKIPKSHAMRNSLRLALEQSVTAQQHDVQARPSRCISRPAVVFDSGDRLRLAVFRGVQMKAVGAVRKQQHSGSGPS